MKEVDPVGLHAQEILEYLKYYIILGQTWTLHFLAGDQQIPIL
jgi:hypothetical protein